MLQAGTMQAGGRFGFNGPHQNPDMTMENQEIVKQNEALRSELEAMRTRLDAMETRTTETR
jgi:hypothetical protein